MSAALIISFIVAALLFVYITWQYMRNNGDVRERKVKTIAVVGSGGHTTEMISLIKKLNPQFYEPLLFVHADTDIKSSEHIRDSNLSFPYTLASIPRSREVGQSYISSIFSTLKALVCCIILVWKEKPSLLIVNGPGTCVPVVLSVLLFRALNLMKCHIVFVESFCRVQKLSMTGFLLYYLVDSFVVQWPQLQKKYSHSVYLGILM